jgi:hypothetical protein
MVQFIHQEAKEKASEIKLKTDEEFNIEKLRMVEQEKAKIRAEYERKEKQVEVQKRIGQSNDVRFSRLKCLKARDDAMQAVLAEAASKLPSLISGPGYAALLESLILEALTQLADLKVVVKGVAGQEGATKTVRKAPAPLGCEYTPPPPPLLSQNPRAHDTSRHLLSAPYAAHTHSAASAMLAVSLGPQATDLASPHQLLLCCPPSPPLDICRLLPAPRPSSLRGRRRRWGPTGRRASTSRSTRRR